MNRLLLLLHLFSFAIITSCNIIKYDLKGAATTSQATVEDISLCQSNAPGGSSDDSQFWSGDGSLGTPYLICTAAQLNLIGTTYQASNFKLINNIDLNFLGSTSFNMIILNTGSFDGDNYQISNLKIEDPSISHWNGTGFFKELYDAQVTQVKFINPSINVVNANNVGIIGYAERTQATDIEITSPFIRASQFVGGLVGASYGSSTYSNIIVTNGDIVTTGQTVGGILGYGEGDYNFDLDYSTFTQILSSQFSGSITSSNSLVGGIVGDGYWLNLDNVQSNGRFQGTVGVGGIAGGLYSAESFINNSSVLGEVYGVTDVGGVLGDSTPVLKILNTTTSADVYASDPAAIAGRLFGQIDSATDYTGSNSTGTLTINGTPSGTDIGALN